jgi:hypothetical protein
MIATKPRLYSRINWIKPIAVPSPLIVFGTSKTLRIRRNSRVRNTFDRIADRHVSLTIERKAVM